MQAVHTVGWCSAKGRAGAGEDEGMCLNKIAEKKEKQSELDFFFFFGVNDNVAASDNPFHC